MWLFLYDMALSMVFSRYVHLLNHTFVAFVTFYPLHSRLGLCRSAPLAALRVSEAGDSLITHLTIQRTIHATGVLCAEPLKKKKRIDPSVLKARDERRKKKLEKQIRRLEKNARQLKPIDEMEVPLVLLDERV